MANKFVNFQRGNSIVEQKVLANEIRKKKVIDHFLMKKISVPGHAFEIHPISQDDLDAVLNVYKQCEDFLALGPVATASMEMVLKDIELSKSEGGIFCGIYTEKGEMVGIIDYVPSYYKGDPATAYLELLLIAQPLRNQGIGNAVVDMIENEIRGNPAVTTILAGVQVNNPEGIRFWQRHGYRIISGPELMPDQTTAFGLQKEIAPGVHP
jgi:ribosomal protein S18 acetylase RimI-like enzyme